LVKFGGRLLFALMPLSLVQGLSPALVDLCLQITTTLAGVLLGFVLLRGSLCDAMGLSIPSRDSAKAAAFGALLAPITIVFSSFVALKIAEPMLVREMAERGAGVSRQNAGAMAQQLVSAPAWLVLLWAVVFAAVFEELLFRGLVWSTFDAFVKAPPTDGTQSQTLSERGSIDDELAAMRGPSAIDRLRASGLVATLGSAIVFSAMHLGIPGGVGVLRVVSTLLLGLACGLARQFSGTVVAAIAIHLVNNFLAVPLVRQAIVSETFPVLEGIPTVLIPVALVGVAGAVIWKFVEKRSERV
jgi:membrane protease YdiL (CAAX protease family)